MRCFLHCYKKRRRGICFSGTVSITEPEEDDRRSALLEKKKKKRRREKKKLLSVTVSKAGEGDVLCTVRKREGKVESLHTL